MNTKNQYPICDINEIYSEERDPFLTVGKFFIGLIVAGFVILSLHVVLLREEAKLVEVEDVQGWIYFDNGICFFTESVEIIREARKANQPWATAHYSTFHKDCEHESDMVLSEVEKSTQKN